MNEQHQLEQPFFARLLETQHTNKAEGAQQFYPSLTLKIFDDIEHTQKYPSDNDEV